MGISTAVGDCLISSGIFVQPVCPFEAILTASLEISVGKTALDRMNIKDTEENNFFVGWKFQTRSFLL